MLALVSSTSRANMQVLQGDAGGHWDDVRFFVNRLLRYLLTVGVCLGCTRRLGFMDICRPEH